MNTAALFTTLLLVQAIGVSAQRSAPGPGYEDRFILNEGRRVHYLDWGSAGKTPFVMLHGIGRSAHSYDHIAPQFQHDYHVIAMDLRGHGDSDWHPAADYLVEDYVKDLERLVEQLELRNIVLTGSSTGGRVAQVYAGLHPERVAKLIVEDVGPERPEDISKGFAQRAERDMKGWASEEELLNSMRQGRTRVPEDMQRNWIRYETKPLENGRVVWKYDPAVTKGFVPTELWDYVKRIKAPTIYLLGAESNIVPPPTQKRLEALLPNIKIVIVPDAGHYPHQETPQVFLAVVQAFLAG
ncbi:MAG TPA: alpha/beta hydrolase [Vicinamibacterales bacterium]